MASAKSLDVRRFAGSHPSSSRASQLLVVLAFVVACDGANNHIIEPTQSQTLAITAGTPETGYPAVFAIAYNGEGGCTGTCIHDNIGLTAAHCLRDLPSNTTLTGLFGDTEASPSETLTITAQQLDPTADIAVVAFERACPATIPHNSEPLESLIGEPVVMVGFGVTTEQANDAGIKRSGRATLFSVVPSQVRGMDPNELATSNQPAGTCSGDSGGPTFMNIGGREVVVGRDLPRQRRCSGTARAVRSRALDCGSLRCFHQLDRRLHRHPQRQCP